MSRKILGCSGKMKTKGLMFGIIIIALSTLPFAECQTTAESIMVMVDQPWWRTIEVNQTTEFIAHGDNGTPPYTFQWYTTFLDPTILPEHWITVPVPNSNSSTFKFVESTLGRYGISVRISDSNGDSLYEAFQPMGIVVTVQSSPQPSATPSPSSTTLPTNDSLPTPSVPEITNMITVSLLVVIPTILAIFLRRSAHLKP